MYSPPNKRCHVTVMQSTLLRSGFGHREIWPSITTNVLTDIGCCHTWDLTLVKGFNRRIKDVKKITIVKLIS